MSASDDDYADLTKLIDTLDPASERCAYQIANVRAAINHSSLTSSQQQKLSIRLHLLCGQSVEIGLAARSRPLC
jgi:hypothetical protein